MCETINEIKTIDDFTNLLKNCSYDLLDSLGDEVIQLNTNGYFPADGMCLKIIDNINENEGRSICSMDIAIPISFEFLKRNCPPF